MFIVRTIIYKWRTFQLATFDYQRLNVQNQNCGPLTIWLVVWNMNFIFPITLGILSSQLTFTPSFFRGVGRYTTNQIFIFIYILFNSLSDHEPNWVSTGVTYVSAGSPDSEGPAADPHPHSPLQFTRQDFHAEQCELQIPGVV